MSTVLQVSPATTEVAETYRRGIESRDGELIASLYAEDCEHVIVNRNSPPSRPTVLRGRESVCSMWCEDTSREMTHRVEALLVDGPRFAMRVTCRYPDGTLVAAMVISELEHGRIKREFEITCWDE